jgi:hypothetical protein
VSIAKGGLLYDYQLTDDTFQGQYLIACHQCLGLDMIDVLTNMTDFPVWLWQHFLSQLADDLTEESFGNGMVSVAQMIPLVPTLLPEGSSLIKMTSYQNQIIESYILSDDFRLSYAFLEPHHFPLMQSGLWSLNVFLCSSITCIYRRVTSPPIVIPTLPGSYYDYDPSIKPGYRVYYPTQAHWAEAGYAIGKEISRENDFPPYDSYINASFWQYFAVPPIPPQSFFGGDKEIHFRVGFLQSGELSASFYDSGYDAASPFSVDYPTGETLAAAHLTRNWYPLHATVTRIVDPDDDWYEQVIPPDDKIQIRPYHQTDGQATRIVPLSVLFGLTKLHLLPRL